MYSNKNKYPDPMFFHLLHYENKVSTVHDPTLDHHYRNDDDINHYEKVSTLHDPILDQHNRYDDENINHSI